MPGRLPPGPDLPQERQTARMVMRPLGFLEELRQRYGEAFTIRVVDERPWVALSDPELIAQVFRAPPDVLHAGEGKQVLAPMLGNNSLLLLDEDRHLEQRKLLLPPFGGNRIAGYEAAMRAAAMRSIDEWPFDSEQPATQWTRPIALDAILRAVFGIRDDDRLVALRAALSELRVPGNAREARRPSFVETLARVDGLIEAEIDGHADDGGDDVLALLLSARREDGSPLSPREIRDQLMTLLVAGYETTATTLAWALERLAHSPAALAAAAEEANAGGGAYTDAVVKETLRLRPPLPVVARAVKAPIALGDWLIPPGTTIMPAILLLHHRPDIYPEPFAFRPERFLGDMPAQGAWIPFGGGVRRCIGARFALLETRVVLSTLLARATVRPAQPAAEAMRRRDVTLTPARGARVILEPR